MGSLTFPPRSTCTRARSPDGAMTPSTQKPQDDISAWRREMYDNSHKKETDVVGITKLMDSHDIVRPPWALYNIIDISRSIYNTSDMYIYILIYIVICIYMVPRNLELMRCVTRMRSPSRNSTVPATCEHKAAGLITWTPFRTLCRLKPYRGLRPISTFGVFFSPTRTAGIRGGGGGINT